MDNALCADELACWLALSRAPGLGPIQLRRLVSACPDIRRLFTAPPSRLWANLPPPLRDYLRNPDWPRVEQDLAWQQADAHHILRLSDPRYPALLRETADPPPLLFVIGNPHTLAAPQLAIVGSRNPTPGGRETAHAFARQLSHTGLTITSGLALGIDAAGHSGALAAQGDTIAVTGCGPDRIYPAAHRQLAGEIARQGALVSEFPPGTPPRREHFPRRNRIISGLSLGTLVVEAARHSGSLITARLALEQGRGVFAIPGSIHNPLARGCHALLRDGATLVEEYTDILEEIAPLARLALDTGSAAPPAVTPRELDEEQQKVLNSLGFEPTTVDSAVARSGLTAERVSSILLALELENMVSGVAGGRYLRKT